jgi:hypothetical protein
VLEVAEDRLGREEALADAAREGVALIDLGTAGLVLAPAAAGLALSAPAGGSGDLLYGRPPAAEERFGPGGAAGARRRRC